MGRRKGVAIFNRAIARVDIDYTERQLRILCNEIPLDEVGTTELVVLQKKAKARMDSYNYEVATLLYEIKKNPHEYRPNLTVDEAKVILQTLTPWKINWT